MTNCPECEALLDIEEDDVEEGDVVNCPECGLELEVVHTHPLEVERVEEEEEEEDSKDEEEGFEEEES